MVQGGWGAVRRPGGGGGVGSPGAFKNEALNLRPHPLVTPLKASSIRGYIEHTNNCRVVLVCEGGGFVSDSVGAIIFFLVGYGNCG